MIIDKDLLKSGASDFGVELDEAALDRFDRFAGLIIEKNKVMNLTSIIEPKDIVIKHFLDSLSLFSAVQPAKGAKVIDVGTGAGLPGIALLIARPDLAVTLLDSTKKKLEFLKEALTELGLSAATYHARAEEAGRKTEYREVFDLAVARAVAGMNELSEYCLPFVKIGGKFVAMKGSITINGVSLTVNEVEGTVFNVNLIPHTLLMTTLKELRTGAKVNLEIDLIARYVERMMHAEREELK